MRGSRILALSMVVLFALSALPVSVDSVTPAVDPADGFYDVDLYLVSENDTYTFNTSSPMGLQGNISCTSGVEFSIELEADMNVVVSGTGGLNLTVFKARSVGLLYPPPDKILTATLSNGSDLVAEGEVVVSALGDYTIDMAFTSGTEYLFSEGSTLDLKLEGEVTVVGDNNGYGMLALHALSIPDITTYTINPRGGYNSTFYVNDWPDTMMNITGVISAAFGEWDIGSVEIEVNGTQEDANRAGLVYWVEWDFSSLGPGDYDYGVTVTDVQNNEYRVDGAFSILDKGLLMTSPLPYQDPEGNGTLVDGISRDGYHSYEVSVRNVGASSVGSTELSIETDPTVPEDHTTHVELDKHTLTDIPADGDEIVLVNVSGQGASIGTVLRFILWAETGGDRYSMAFAIEIVPFRSVSLNSTYRKEGGDWRTDDVYAYPGEEVEFKVTVKNTSPDEEDRFNITFSPQEESGWTLDFSIEYGEILHLDVGESDVFYVNVTAPSRSDIPDGPFTITITAHAMDGSVVNESVAETWRLITNAVVGVGITGADTETASADTDGDFEEVEFEFEVDNQYDEAATLMFSVSSPSGWKDEKPKVYVGSTPTSSKLVPAPDPITLKVKVRPTLETAAGDYEFELKVQKDSDIYETKKFTLTLEPMILFKLKPESKEYTGAVAGDGSVLIISVDVFNKGNYKENVTIKASIYTAQGDRELLDWPISVATSNVDPAPQGAGREINITLTIPRDVETGEYVLVLMVEDSDGEEVEISGEDEITIFVEAPMGQMVSIALSEMWLQLLLFVGVIVLALMAARKKNSGQVSG